MKFDTLPSIYLVLAAFVPGFMYNGVLMNFVPLRQNKEKELIILRFLTITSFKLRDMLAAYIFTREQFPT